MAQDPVNFEAVYQDALISAKKGDTSKAIRELEFLSNSFPRNALVRYQLASAYLLSAINASEVNVRNATESAENRVSEAIKLDPKLEPAVLLFAELKIRKGSAAAAIEPFEGIDQGDDRRPRKHIIFSQQPIWPSGRTPKQHQPISRW